MTDTRNKHEDAIDKRVEASRIAAQKMLERVATKMEQLDRWLDDPPDGETWIARITLKPFGGADGDFLMIVKATVGGEDMVCFHSGDGLIETLVGFTNRLGNGSLKWRKDTPYEGK